jgi:GNAT superfamily N-acetyltransferase
MVSSLQIRRALPSEYRRLAEIHVIARYDMTYLPHVHSFTSVEKWMREIVLPSQEALVAETDGTVVAYAWLHEGFLRALYVHPSYQRRGIGSELLAEIRKTAPGGFSLWVFEANEGAIRFYEIHGAKFVRKTDGSANQEKLPDRLMSFGYA